MIVTATGTAVVHFAMIQLPRLHLAVVHFRMIHFARLRLRVVHRAGFHTRAAPVLIWIVGAAIPIVADMLQCLFLGG